MALVSDLINLAFLDIGAIAAGQTPTSDEQADALTRLNSLLDSWSREHVSVFQESHLSCTLTAGTIAYTLGVSANSPSFVASAQPMRVYSASATSGAFRAPVKVMSFAALHEMAANNLGTSAVLPQAVGVDQNWPNINLEVFPPPSTSPGTLILDFWTVISQFTSLSNTITLPAGYVEALHWNLALALYPEYARQGTDSQVLMFQAQRSKAALTSLNAEILGTAPEEVDTETAPPKGSSQQ